MGSAVEKIICPRVAVMIMIFLCSISFGRDTDSVKSFSLVLGDSIHIGNSRITFHAFQYLKNQGGMLPSPGRTAQTYQILLFTDGYKDLYLPNDSIHTVSFSGIVDSIVTRNDTLRAYFTYESPVKRTTPVVNRVTLINFNDSQYVAAIDKSYKLIRPSPKTQYPFNIEVFSPGKGRDTIPQLVNDAGITLDDYVYYEQWQFSGYKSYVAFDRKSLPQPQLFGISFCIEKRL